MKVCSLRPGLAYSCLAYVLLAFACTMVASPMVYGPVQGWQHQRGPVVPHDKFPDDCSLCHVGAGWHKIRADFEFDHKAKTGVELKGAHKKAECLRCHNDRGPVKKFADRGCRGCHEDWHQGTLGPRCEDCHEERDWQPKAMIAKHALTRFPLTGAHAGTACWRCHEGAQVGNFKRASTECVVCHRDALTRALNPNHVANGWTTRCQRCHSPVGWQGASFAHPFVLTGPHRTTCSNCHTTPGNYGLYSCFTCHAHDKTQMDDTHKDVTGYVYTSTACYTCHPGARK